MNRITVALLVLACGLAATSTASACAMFKRPQLIVAQSALDEGIAAEKAGELHSAVRHYERAMYGEGSNDARADAALRAGRLHVKLGNAEQAADRLRRAVSLKPEDPAARVALGAQLLGADDAGAAEHLQAALRAKLSRADRAVTELALARALVGLDRTAEAAAHLARARSLGVDVDAAAAVDARIQEKGGLAVRM